MKGLSGKIALVTGATGLIGGAVARRLAAEGATVVVASRRIEKANEWIRANAGAEAIRLLPLALDLAAEDSINSAFEQLAKTVGAPDILVASASARDGLAIPFEELDHDSFGKLFGVDVAGHFLCARRMVEMLDRQAAAGVVFLSSVYALRGVDHRIYPKGMSPTPVQYAAVKSAMLGLTRYLAALWGARGVRVNAVLAGGVRSPTRQSDEFARNYARRTMLGRMATPEEIAGAVAFLASDEAAYITAECLVVDGGFSAW